MRYIFVLMAFTCSCIVTTGQKNPNRFDLEVFDASKFKTLTVEIETKAKTSLQTHFNAIIIRDLRADKSKLGFARAGEKIENRRFVFPGADEEYLAKRLNRLFSGSSQSRDTVLITLNNLWLFETKQQARAVKRELLGEIQLFSHCLVNYDVYLYKQGALTPLGSVDTVITTNGWIVNKSSDLLTKALITLLTVTDSLFNFQKAGQTNLSIPGSDLPIPIIAEQYKKGIHFTYRDFLSNNADTVAFTSEIKNGKRIVKTSAYPDSILARCWGFCDGNGIYININNDYYRLNRSQNTFDVRAPLLVDIKNSTFSKIFRTAYSYFLIDAPLIDPSELIKPGNETLEFFKYYQLDIRTGSLR